jgi:nitroreductase
MYKIVKAGGQMDFMECVKTRRSIRKFKEEDVAFESIQKAVEAAVYAPSWKNTQITRYYAVSNKDMKDKIAGYLPSINQVAAQSAPVLMVVSVVKYRSGYNREGKCDTPKGTGWQMFDCGLSSMLFCLKANELGLGTVIMGYFDEDAIAKDLEIPDTEEVSAIIALGYPDEEPVMPKRKGTDIILKQI